MDSKLCKNSAFVPDVTRYFLFRVIPPNAEIYISPRVFLPRVEERERERGWRGENRIKRKNKGDIHVDLASKPMDHR